MVSTTGNPESSSHSAPSTEFELKLLGSSEQLRSLMEGSLLESYACGPAVSKKLVATYFDTADLDLKKSGMTLRVRTDGRRHVMTVKSGGGIDGLGRSEWEAPIRGRIPNMAALASILPASTFAHIKDSGLRPQFKTEIRRHTRLLEVADGVVEVAIDEGRILAGDQSEEVREVELELKRGLPSAVLQLALQLISKTSLRPSIRSKAARGFDLTENKCADYSKAPKLELEEGITLDQALRRILESTVYHLMDNQAAAEAGEQAEAIHQYRVALRRLRSMLGLVRKIAPSPRLEAFGAEAKWLMACFNETRAWDVFLAENLPHVAEACPRAREGFSVVRSTAIVCRGNAHQGVRSVLADPRTGQFQIALLAWIGQNGWRSEASAEGLALLAGTAQDFAAMTLHRLHRKVLRRGRNFRDLAPPARHEVRLALKKLRYAMDFFMPLLCTAKKSNGYRECLTALQDQLGQHNDISALEDLIGHIIESGGDLTPDGQRAIGALIGWRAAKLAQDDSTLLTAWKEFRTTKLPRLVSP